MANNKIKLVHVVTTLETGGMENGIINLCNGHDKERFEPIICCLKSLGSMAPRLKPEIQLINLNLTEGRSLLFPLKMARLFHILKPEVVHTHGLAGGSYHGIIGAKLAGVPVIVNGEHGSFFVDKHQIILQRILTGLCDAYLSVSESLKIKVSENLGISAGRIKVIPNGVNINHFNRAHDIAGLRKRIFEEYEFEIKEGDFVIGSIGSLKPEKNQKMLLKAVAYLKDNTNKENNIKVLFLGKGDDLNDLRDISKSIGIDNQVVFLGARDDVPQLLSMMNVIVSTSISKHEGMSNVILEAMASGLPVITTDSIGSAELVEEGHTGFVIEPDNIWQLAEKISILYEDRNLSIRMGDHAQRIARECYSIEKMISGYEDLYENLLNKSGW